MTPQPLTPDDLEHLPSGWRVGWKVMRRDPGMRPCDGRIRLVSGADARLAWAVRAGDTLAMPRPGVWMTLDPAYALAHYAVHDHQALVALGFDPGRVAAGSLDDRETEFACPEAVVLSIAIVDAD